MNDDDDDDCEGQHCSDYYAGWHCCYCGEAPPESADD